MTTTIKIYLYGKMGNFIDFLHAPSDYKNKFETYFPEYDDKDIYISEEELSNPILENGKIREKTRLELAMEQDNILANGEYIADGEIKYKEMPSDVLKPIWNKESKEWEETISKEELIELRKTKIIKYEELKKEKEILDKSEFSSINEKEIVSAEMNSLKDEINSIQEKVNKIK